MSTRIRPARLRPGRIAFAVYTTLVIVFIFLPIASALVFSFNADRFPGLPWGGFTLDWYRDALADDAIHRGFANSLKVAVFVAPIATVLGFGAAYVSHAFRFPGRNAYGILLGLPPAVPLVVFGVAMLTFLSRIGLSGTLTGIVCAHVVLAVPFSMILIRLRLADLDDNIEQAAWNLGATRFAALRDVVIPFVMPAIGASLFLTAAVSFDEFMVAWFVSGLNETLPVRLLVLLQSGQVSPLIKAVGSLVFLVSIALVATAQLFIVLFLQRSNKGRRG